MKFFAVKSLLIDYFDRNSQAFGLRVNELLIDEWVDLIVQSGKKLPQNWERELWQKIRETGSVIDVAYEYFGGVSGKILPLDEDIDRYNMDSQTRKSIIAAIQQVLGSME